MSADIGTVIKVVFATLQTEITPVIAETINVCVYVQEHS